MKEPEHSFMLVLAFIVCVIWATSNAGKIVSKGDEYLDRLGYTLPEGTCECPSEKGVSETPFIDPPGDGGVPREPLVKEDAGRRYIVPDYFGG